MHTLLLSKFSEVIDLTAEEVSLCKTLFIPKKLRKKQYILQEGDVARYISFVEKGLMRSFSVDEKDNEHILQFAMEGWWISDIYSFLTAEPSHYHIEAIEDSELLLLDKTNWEKLLQQVPKMERYFRILMQNNMIALQKRLTSSHSESAEQKYLGLSTMCPDIIQRIPQHMIASFLGVSAETLSRIRKHLSQVK